MLAIPLLALALTQAPGVLVRCAEPCTVTLDGRTGRRVDEKTAEVLGLQPGSRKLEVLGRAGPIFVGFVNVPALGSAIDLDAQGHVKVTPPVSAPPPPLVGVPETTPAAPGPSVVTVRCPMECTVTVDGLTGRRLNAATWEVSGVKPGSRRVEADGVFGNKIAASYLDIPAEANVEVIVLEGSVSLGTVSPRAPQPPAVAPATGPSTLHVMCPNRCTVWIDGQRRSGENQSALISDVAPGRHGIEARYFGGQALGTIDVPAGSEVFLVANEGGSIVMTSARPLGP